MLPAYKGMYTSAHPILNGDRATGVTLHRIDAGIDTGEIVAQLAVPIDDATRCRDLYRRYTGAGAALVRRCLPDLLAGRETSRPQPAVGSSYYSRRSIDYSNVAIDLKQTAHRVQRQVNAFHHRDYQIPSLFGEPISRIEILPERSASRPGEIVSRDEEGERIRFATIDYDCVAVPDRFDELMEAVRADRPETIERLVGNDPTLLHEASREGWTPLIVAAYAGLEGVVRLLLRLGADAGQANQKGTTPLMYAKNAFLRTGSPGSLHALAAAGASDAATDLDGLTIYDYTPAEDRPRLRSIIGGARR